MNKKIYIENKKISSELRKKYKKQGYHSMSEKEKLMLLLSYSEKESNIREIADKIIDECQSMNNVINMDILVLINGYGLSRNSAVLMNSISKLKNLCCLNDLVKNKRMNNVEDYKLFFRSLLSKNKTEKIIFIIMDKKFHIINYFIQEGNKNSIEISCSKIYTLLKEKNADYMFISHNHPNSNAEPSSGDIFATKKIIGLTDMFNIKLIDHIIVSTVEAVSMYEIYGEKIFRKTEYHKRYIRKDES